jgi:hypothetical protein
MNEMVLNTSILPEPIFSLIHAEKVKVEEIDGGVKLLAVDDTVDCTIGLRGILAGYEEMTVDKFLKRMRIDGELDL